MLLPYLEFSSRLCLVAVERVFIRMTDGDVEFYWTFDDTAVYR